MTSVIIIFLLNSIVIVINKKIVKPMGSTRPMWVGLDLCDGLGWVEFFLTHHDELDQNIPLTQPNPTHAHPNFNKLHFFILSLYHMCFHYSNVRMAIELICQWPIRGFQSIKEKTMKEFFHFFFFFKLLVVPLSNRMIPNILSKL